MKRSLTGPPWLASILALAGPRASPDRQVDLIFITRCKKVSISRTKMIVSGIASRLNFDRNGMQRALRSGHGVCVHREASEAALLSKGTWEHLTSAEEEYF